MVVCRTGAAHSERPEHLVLNADGTQVRVESIHFQYTSVDNWKIHENILIVSSENPSIERVPRPVNTLSGGIQLDVQGRHLDLLQRPRMVVSWEGQLFWGARCEIVDEHLMVFCSAKFM